jgi:hypothetical protein
MKFILKSSLLAGQQGSPILKVSVMFALRKLLESRSSIFNRPAALPAVSADWLGLTRYLTLLPLISQYPKSRGPGFIRCSSSSHLALQVRLKLPDDVTVRRLISAI